MPCRSSRHADELIMEGLPGVEGVTERGVVREHQTCLPRAHLPRVVDM